ncbi:unnamed protein product [Gadus morhua 'NCC']
MESCHVKRHLPQGPGALDIEPGPPSSLMTVECDSGDDSLLGAPGFVQRRRSWLGSTELSSQLNQRRGVQEVTMLKLISTPGKVSPDSGRGKAPSPRSSGQLQTSEKRRVNPGPRKPLLHKYHECRELAPRARASALLIVVLDGLICSMLVILLKQYSCLWWEPGRQLPAYPANTSLSQAQRHCWAPPSWSWSGDRLSLELPALPEPCQDSSQPASQPTRRPWMLTETAPPDPPVVRLTQEEPPVGGAVRTGPPPHAACTGGAGNPALTTELGGGTRHLPLSSCSLRPASTPPPSPCHP